VMVWLMGVGIEYTDWEGCFDASDSVLFQGGVYTVYYPPHRFCSKTRFKEYSTRQVISDHGNLNRLKGRDSWGVDKMYSRLDVI
jgi:hypothetical protein